MYLKSLSIISFKNIANAHLTLSPSINAFVGDNGAGKTNIIDAIHYLSMCKSMLTMTDGQSVRHGDEFFMLDGAYSMDDERHESVVCSFSRQRGKGKSVKRNGKEYEKLSDHVGLLPVVVVSPQDSVLITDAAQERRRNLDSFISQLDSRYLAALIRYKALLAERNRLLKMSVDESMLEVYDMQLCAHASVIYDKRCEVVKLIEPLVAGFYAQLSGESQDVSVEYSSQLNECDLMELFRQTRQKDFVNEHTTAGVHRDDLIFKIGGYPLRKYGSQGQQKSFLIAFKLAQYMVLTQLREVKPILLLDDLFDKLDSSRVEGLLHLVSGDEFGQIFISDCHDERLQSILNSAIDNYSLFRVAAGEVESK